jgi:hypothetical protein
VDDPLTVKKQNKTKEMSIDLILDLLILAFLGRGDFAVCHSRLWRFVSGSYSKSSGTHFHRGGQLHSYLLPQLHTYATVCVHT